MEPNKTAIERAFEIAKAGGDGTLLKIRQQLNAEGYDVHSVAGPLLSKQLREIAKKAQASS